MTRSLGRFSVLLALGLAIAGTAFAQAAAEAGMGAAGASMTAGPARSTGKAIGGIASSLDKVIKAGQSSSDAKPASATTTVSPDKLAPSVSTPPAGKWEDPGGIAVGLAYEELVRRFGPPSLEISSEAGRSLAYASKDGTFRVELVDGKVTAIRKPKP